MADLKINQLDPIIYVSSGTGAAFNALSDADLFIVKMKVRGTAIGDEDRKLTWLELRNSLNLGQYMPTIGGNFTGDITMNNSKGVKSQQSGSGSDIYMLALDSSNRVNVGSTTNLTRIQSSSVPQFVDGTGTYNFITSKNLPVPGDINAYTKSEVDSKLSFKFDKNGGDISGDINLTTNASRLYGYTTDGMKASLAYITAGNTANYGHSTLHTNLVSTDVPSWTNGSQTYDLITKGNLPVPGDINAYTKSEVDAALALKVNMSGTGTAAITGSVAFMNGQGITARDTQNTTRTVVALSGMNQFVGDIGTNLKFRSAVNPTVQVGNTTEYQVYHQGNKPTVAELGLSDTVNKAASALQDGAFGLGSTTPHKADAGFLSVNDATQFFVQDGGSTEQRFGRLGAGIHINYGQVGTGNSAQYRSASLFIGQDNKLISKWSTLDYTGNTALTQTATYFSDMNPPTATQVGAYSKAESDSIYARKGVNADITQLNALTGALKVGANATQPLEVTTLQQVQALTSGTAGAVVGVVGGYVGAVMWFNGTRATIPAGWVPADGQQISRTDYPDLWNAVKSGALVLAGQTGLDSDWIGTRTARGAYSYGPSNSTTTGTTFRVPDLNGKRRKNDTVDGSAFTGDDSIHALFLRGDGNDASDNIGSGAGVIRPSAAPNIKGQFSILSNGASPGSHLNTDRWSGPFYRASNSTGSSQDGYTSSFNNQYAGDTGFDASRSDVAYGRDNATEVRPNSVQGIWIIRASNNFEAANTNFAVYNGSGTAPSDGTLVQGGAVQSIYNIQGVQASAFNMAVAQQIGSPAYGRLSVSSQGAYGGGTTKSWTYTFSADGLLTAGSLAGVTGTFSGALSGANVIATNGAVRIQNSSNELNFSISGSSATVNRTTGLLSWDFGGLAVVNANGIQSTNNMAANGGLNCYTATGAIINQGGPTLASVMRDGGTSTGRVRANFDFWCRGNNVGQRQGVIRVHGDDMGGEQNWIFNGAGTDAGRISGSAGKLAIDTSSDAILKNIIGDMDCEAAADRIDRMKFRDYKWNDHEYNMQRGVDREQVQHGQIAQELEKIDPRYVSIHEQPLGSIDEGRTEQIRTLNNDALLMDALATIQLLRREVAELKAAAK